MSGQEKKTLKSDIQDLCYPRDEREWEVEQSPRTRRDKTFGVQGPLRMGALIMYPMHGGRYSVSFPLGKINFLR
jgi:hypothetical protein